MSHKIEYGRLGSIRLQVREQDGFGTVASDRS